MSKMHNVHRCKGIMDKWAVAMRTLRICSGRVIDSIPVKVLPAINVIHRHEARQGGRLYNLNPQSKEYPQNYTSAISIATGGA